MRFDENALRISVDGRLKYMEMYVFSKQKHISMDGPQSYPSSSEPSMNTSHFNNNWKLIFSKKQLKVSITKNFAIVQFVLKLWLIYAL